MQRLTTPYNWAVSSQQFRDRRVASSRFHRLLKKADEFAGHWLHYSYLVTRRMNPKDKEKYSELEHEYCLVVNDLFDQLEKELLWYSLKK